MHAPGLELAGVIPHCRRQLAQMSSEVVVAPALWRASERQDEHAPRCHIRIPPGDLLPYPNDDIWLTDGYGDYVRHYLRAMASMPELAPDDQNHLLRTTSAVQKIEYATGSIAYRKFDRISEERLKLGAGVPLRVLGGTYYLESSDEGTDTACIRAGSSHRLEASRQLGF